MQTLAALGTGWALLILLERLLITSPHRAQAIWPWASVLLFLGSTSAFFTAGLLVFQRPWFAMVLMLAFHTLILLVNQAKYRSLREPFLVQDFEYFTDVFIHPRLYLPFLSWWRAGLALAGFLAAVWAGLSFEPSLAQQCGWILWLCACALLVVASAVMLIIGYRNLAPPALEPDADVRHYGMIGALWAYARELMRCGGLDARPEFTGDTEVENSAPHMLVVQSESFFDPRQYYSIVRPDVLENFDRYRQTSSLQGQVSVPAWGANTVRTESAFLTGLNPQNMGIQQFNPYWHLARSPVHTLVSCLRRQGYETICIHPYPKDFYLRHKVFPNLGFDRFIDIEAFNESEKDGQYISDAALATRIEKELVSAQNKPLFIFAITMENHGPLHFEATAGINHNDYLNGPLPEGCDDLLIYLRHLKNADQMLARLIDLLSVQPRPGKLCWYGDHVPIMAQVYQKLGDPVADTPYLIWDSRTPGSGQSLNLPVSELALAFLQGTKPILSPP